MSVGAGCSAGSAGYSRRDSCSRHATRLTAAGLDMALGVLAFTVATADLLSALLETPRSWPPLHPLIPEQASRVKAKATCRWRLVGGVFIVFPHNSSNLKWFRKSRQYTS